MQASKQKTDMNIVFEDEDDFEYSEGLDDFTQHIKAIENTISESSRGRATVSERTRTLANRKAVPCIRSPSPMDVDLTVEEMRGVEERRAASIMGPLRANPKYMDIRGERSPPSISGPVQSKANPVHPSTTPARVSPGGTTPTAAANPPLTSASGSAPGSTIPSKRHTDRRDARGLSSPPPSQITPPPPKRQNSATRASQEIAQGYRPDFGTELEPFIIAHDPVAQRLLDEFQLAWGVVYEIARGITKSKSKDKENRGWTWSDVTREKLEQLHGRNANAAQRVIAVMQGGEVPRFPAAELWAEYDREQDAILENKGRGLGAMPSGSEWKGKDNWYGGRIQQVGRLKLVDGAYTIELERPEIRRSHRFSRFLGSRRILQVRVPGEHLYQDGDKVRRLLHSSKFILCGRVFLPFHAKESSMYLMETNQDYQRVSSWQDGDHLRMSLAAFIDWHNPLGLNDQQPISKWSTRWALGLSTSVPTIEFEPQNIKYDEVDIFAQPKDWDGKPPAEKTMTDGCGFINGAALIQIMRVMKYGLRPTAVQGRIGGAKGMWVLHPEPAEQVPDGPAKIWIRPSQHKIKLNPSHQLGKAQRIFDLLAPSRVTGPSHLSSQTVVNLAHNGISDSLLKELMAKGLKEELQPFFDWTQPHSMVLLWKAVERAGNVVMNRLRRMLIGQARAIGLGQLHPMDFQSQEDEEGDDLAHLQPLIDSAHKRFSGSPLSLHESVLELLQSGFHPKHLNCLFQKLETVVSLVVDDYVEKFHIPVMESREAYIIPDPYGVLEEGQIHFRSSDPFINLFTGEQTDIIIGDVLVSRNPTRLPSDVQKVKAIAHEKLYKYVNVIIFPVKGKQSLASFLGGGDYDGDTVMLNWHKDLVEQFKGSPLYTTPPDIPQFFERKIEQVRDFDKKVSGLGIKEAQQSFQEVLLLGLAETKVGIYSKFHDVAVYMHGYGSEAAIYLAYMFTTCLDASKSGLRVKEHEFENHRQVWGHQKPWYEWKLGQKEGKDNKAEKKEDVHQCLHKPANSPFILDELVKEGEKLKKEELEKYGKLHPMGQSGKEDQDLCQPWKTARARATHARSKGVPGFAKNLEVIQAHVQDAWDQYRRALNLKPNPGANLKALLDDVAEFFSRPLDFKESFLLLSEEDVRILKASYASTICLSFAFSVAFHDLCVIKARSVGYLPITHQFAQCFSVPRVVSRMLSPILSGDADL